MVIAVSIIWAQNKCSSVLFFEKGNTWIYHLLLVVAITDVYRPVCVCLFLWICFSKNSFSGEKKIRIIFIPFSVRSNLWWPFEKKIPSRASVKFILSPRVGAFLELPEENPGRWCGGKVLDQKNQLPKP